MKGNICIPMMLVLLPAVSSKMKVVDLTWIHGPTSVFWPEGGPFNFTVMYRGNQSQYWYELNWFGTPEHGNTHLDSPSHFFEGGLRMHQIPPERLIGPAVVIDVRSKVKGNVDYRVTVTDITDFETNNGRIPEGAIVLMNSGWGSRYPDKTKVYNTNEPENPSTYHFPGYHEDAVQWLITNRKIGIVGVDTPSTDYGHSREFKVHQLIGKHSVLGIENVAYLDDIPVKGATIIVGAIKLFDGSGGPARILATYDDDDDDDEQQCDCTYLCGKVVAIVTIVFATILFFSWTKIIRR